MIKNMPFVLVVALAAGLAAAPPWAEEEVLFGLQALEDRFNAAAPSIGQQVPDVPVYTADGEKLGFRNLVRGHYSVVVFGCLT